MKMMMVKEKEEEEEREGDNDKTKKKNRGTIMTKNGNRMDLFALLRIMLIKCSHLSLLRHCIRLYFSFPDLVFVCSLLSLFLSLFIALLSCVFILFAF